MKVGVFTFPNSTSFGAVLQMYALFHSVEKLGHDAEIVNYQNAYMKSSGHVVSEGSGFAAAKRWLRSLLHLRQRMAFRRFEKRAMCKYPARTVENPQTLSEIGKRYGAVICGSDQVWNPDITGGDISYFLSFCSAQTKRISYAPSFGIETFSDDFCRAIQGELEQFSAISVREAPGQALIRSLLDKEVPVVVDPTFLLSAEEWEALERPHPTAQGEYILYYTIRRSHTLYQKCRELSAKTGLRVVIVGGNPLKRIKNRDPLVDYAVDISPEEWLYLVRNARYVVTNSFHGTAFSVNFRKDFYLEFSSLTNSRLSHIVDELGLQARVVTADSPIEPSATDYRRADERLPILCNHSLEYLKNALHEEVNNG